MRPLPIESPTLFTAPEPPPAAPERVREQAPPDPRAARFGQLFARVFGEQTRQPVAAGANTGPGASASPAATAHATQHAESQADGGSQDKQALDRPMGADQDADPSTLRALKIGEGTEIITAGPPPADEDLLRYARDASMDEGSVAALLRHGRLVDWAGLTSGRASTAQTGLGSAPGAVSSDDGDAAALADGAVGDGKVGKVGKGAKSAQSDLALLHTAQEALILKGQDGLVTARGTDSVVPLSTSTAATLLPGTPASAGLPGTASAAARALFPNAPVTAQPSEPGFSVSLATGASGSEMATSRWMQSRAGSVEGAAGPGAGAVSEESLDPTTPAALKHTEADSKLAGSAKFDFEALRLRLGLEDSSTKDRLIKILGPEAVRANEVGPSEAVRLEAISLVEQPIDIPEGLLPADRTVDALLGESEGLAALTAGGSPASGQGGGEGGRPDPNAAGQAGQPRSLPQQILQRFGELLSQRLLQQVSQGNWRVELDLEPGDLGSIRIELELRKGEIEASIKATQASTRDLLQESLPRLKEALERNGMDVASLSVSQQDRRQSGGQSPSGRQSSGAQGSDAEQGPEMAVGVGKTPAQDDGRLDVWV